MKLIQKLLVALLVVLPLSAAKASDKDIVDTAVGAGSFNTLVAAVQAAGPGRHPEGRWPLHRIRTDRRSLRQAAGAPLKTC
jgi:hypothetical protein